MYRVNWQEIKRKQMLKFKVKKKGGGCRLKKIRIFKMYTFDDLIPKPLYHRLLYHSNVMIIVTVRINLNCSYKYHKKDGH